MALKNLLIVGGGFAGFWSAMSAVRQSREIQRRSEVNIILVNPDNYVTIRPKSDELFFAGSDFKLDKYLKPLDVRQIIGRVDKIDPVSKIAIVASGGVSIKISYDCLIIATGASLHLPDLPGISNAFGIESYRNAKKLDDHIQLLGENDFQGAGASTFIVVGSEFTGLDTVARLEKRIRKTRIYNPGKKSDFSVMLFESSNTVGSQFSFLCQQYIRRALDQKKIEILLNAEIESMDEESVLLHTGERIPVKTVIWTKGLMASGLTDFFESQKDELKRLNVDKYLKLPAYDDVIAAGNVAHKIEHGTSSLMDCQYAQFEGRWAGHNAINHLFDEPLKEYVQPGYVFCVDLGEPFLDDLNISERSIQEKRYKQSAAEQYLNEVMMYPWQDIAETVRSSYPEIPKF